MQGLSSRLSARIGSIRNKVVVSGRTRTSASSFRDLSAKLNKARERVRQSRPVYRA